MSPTPDFTATLTLSSINPVTATVHYTLGESTNPAPIQNGSLLIKNKQYVRFAVVNNTNSPGKVDLVVLPQYCRVNGKSSRGGPFHGNNPNLPGVFYMSSDVPDSWTIQAEHSAANNTYAEYAIVALLPSADGTMDAVPVMIDPSMIINPT